MTRSGMWLLQRRAAPYRFVAPFVILFCVFLAYPLLRSMVLSFYQTSGPGRANFVGTGNYAFLARDKYFWLAVLNTTLLGVSFVAIQIPLSLGLALLLNRDRLRYRAAYRFAFFSTHLVGGVFVSVLFQQMLNPRQGLVNKAIGWVVGVIGIPPPNILWLQDPILARVSILLAWLWLSVGFGMIYFLAALQGVDRELYEAAEVDGARSWSKFWHVTLPGIRPVLSFLVLFGLIGAFQLFEIPYVLFPGSNGPDNAGLTIVSYLFTTGFQAGDLGYASAIGWALVVIILAVTSGMWFLRERDA